MAPDPSWFGLIQACLQQEISNPASRYVQLATLTTDGKPAVRTVVFRGWFTYHSYQQTSPLHALKIVTDVRSSKIAALRKHPWAEICWYFVNARKQFRLSARHVRIVDGDEVDPVLVKARVDQWTALSNTARLQFCYPPPGLHRPDIVNGKDSFKPDNPSPAHPENTFVLLLVEPHTVDVLDLHANERWLFCRQDDNSWTNSFLNP